MNSWKQRLQKYNHDNNIVVPHYNTISEQNNINLQVGGAGVGGAGVGGAGVGGAGVGVSVEDDDPFFNNITINGVTMSTQERPGIQLVKTIINIYNQIDSQQ